jgi:hypothetical protein
MIAATVITVSVVSVILLVALIVEVGRVAEESLRLRREVAFFSDLRPALAELRNDLRITGETWERLGRR